jgi:hypothetical protein
MVLSIIQQKEFYIVPLQELILDRASRSAGIRLMMSGSSSLPESDGLAPFRGAKGNFELRRARGTRSLKPLLSGLPGTDRRGAVARFAVKK